jgi:hypothetical protein
MIYMEIVLLHSTGMEKIVMAVFYLLVMCVVMLTLVYAYPVIVQLSVDGAKYICDYLGCS